MSLVLLGVLNQQLAGGGAVGAFDLLETQVLSSSATSVSFTGLSTYAADYQHLHFRMSLQSTQNSEIESVRVRLNGNTPARTHKLSARYSVTSGNEITSEFGFMTGRPDGANTRFSAHTFDLLDFASITKNKVARVNNGNLGTNVDGYFCELRSLLWTSTLATSTIEFFTTSGSINTNSRISLYGIKAG